VNPFNKIFKYYEKAHLGIGRRIALGSLKFVLNVKHLFIEIGMQLTYPSLGEFLPNLSNLESLKVGPPDLDLQDDWWMTYVDFPIEAIEQNKSNEGFFSQLQLHKLARLKWMELITNTGTIQDEDLAKDLDKF